MKNLLAIFFLILSAFTLKSQVNAQWTLGSAIVFEGLNEDNISLGYHFMGSVNYEFNRINNNLFSSELNLRLGYFDFQDQELKRPTSTMGVAFFITDEKYGNKLGGFIDYAWSYKNYIAGVIVQSTLYEEFINENLDLMIGVQLGFDNRHKSRIIIPNIGMKIEF